MKVLRSSLDSSINLVEDHLVGFIETRYVRRTSRYFIGYLSSQTGCNRGCRMCHLTASNQTQFINCTMDDFVGQMEMILSHYDGEESAEYMHINWMARGEPLNNPVITDGSTDLLITLGNMARSRNLPTKFNISTIMPRSIRGDLVQMFPFVTPTIYYSIYSVSEDFRRRWLPGAMEVSRALEILSDYQSHSKKIVKFHCAFIKDENDQEKDIHLMMSTIARYGIRGEFNIVRYNPFSPQQGVESDRIDSIAGMIGQYMPCKVIPRVGLDVSASCGTFVGS